MVDYTPIDPSAVWRAIALLAQYLDERKFECMKRIMDAHGRGPGSPGQPHALSLSESELRILNALGASLQSVQTYLPATPDVLGEASRWPHDWYPNVTWNDILDSGDPGSDGAYQRDNPPDVPVRDWDHLRVSRPD